MFQKCDSSIDRNEWLLLSAFQQGLRRNLGCFCLTVTCRVKVDSLQVHKKVNEGLCIGNKFAYSSFSNKNDVISL